MNPYTATRVDPLAGQSTSSNPFPTFNKPTVGLKESDNKLPVEYDWDFLEAQLKRLSKNKSKYPKNNWQKPIDIESLKDSLFRHVISIMKGEYTDEGVELDHFPAIALNAMFIYYQLKNNK